MMFSLPDFSVKRPVCVFICLVSLILFGVSSVFEMPLESTPEMNMPTMTIMTSYPDASPDEVDEMVTQKIESALSGTTEVESMTSTSSEGSSMIMLEFGCDVDTDDKYQDITSALAMGAASGRLFRSHRHADGFQQHEQFDPQYLHLHHRCRQCCGLCGGQYRAGDRTDRRSGRCGGQRRYPAVYPGAAR